MRHGLDIHIHILDFRLGLDINFVYEVVHQNRLQYFKSSLKSCEDEKKDSIKASSLSPLITATFCQLLSDQGDSLLRDRPFAVL